jgi:hypothetical protein
MSRVVSSQELERVRGQMVEEVMAALSRCTDQAQRFVLIEGMYV